MAAIALAGPARSQGGQASQASSVPLAALESLQDRACGSMPAVTIDGRTYEEVAIRNRASAPLSVEPLGVPGVARQLAAGSASANTALTSTCRRISVRAVGADIRYAIGSSSQTATATSHFIANGERLDLAVPATPNIAVIRNASTSGTLEVTELI